MAALRTFPVLALIALSASAPTFAGPLDSYLSTLSSTATSTPAMPAHAVFDAQLSATMLKRAVARSKEETEPVRDRILDACVFGIARSRANVDAEPIPDAQHATVDIVVSGITRTDSVGFQEPVKIYTLSDMPFVVRKRVRLDDRGVTSAAACAQVKAMTCLRRITDMQGEEFALVDAATRVFYETLGEATLWVECKARARLISRLDTEVAPQLKEAQQVYATGLKWVRENLTSVGKIGFHSTRSSVGVAVGLASRNEPATAAPPLPASWDVAFRLHENMVNELARSALANKTYPLEEISNLGESLMDLLPGKKKSNGPKLEKKPSKGNGSGDQPPLPTSFGDDKKGGKDAAGEGVAITFARKDPVTVTFADQKVQVVVHGESYKLGDEVYQGFKAIVSYRIDNRKGEVFAVREGTPEIQALDDPSSKRKKLPKAEQAFLREAIENFSERLPLPEIALPAPWDKVGVLLPARVEAKDHWLLIAWQRKS